MSLPDDHPMRNVPLPGEKALYMNGQKCTILAWHRYPEGDHQVYAQLDGRTFVRADPECFTYPKGKRRAPVQES